VDGWLKLESTLRKTRRDFSCLCVSGITREFSIQIRHVMGSCSLPPIPTVEYGQYQKAGELGERYEDFRVLVHLCEKMGSRGQLRDYMTRFSDRVRSGHIVT